MIKFWFQALLGRPLRISFAFEKARGGPVVVPRLSNMADGGSHDAWILTVVCISLVIVERNYLWAVIARRILSLIKSIGSQKLKIYLFIYLFFFCFLVITLLDVSTLIWLIIWRWLCSELRNFDPPAYIALDDVSPQTAAITSPERKNDDAALYCFATS